MKTYAIATGIFILFGLNAASQEQDDFESLIIDTIISEDGRIAYGIKIPGIPPENYRAPEAIYNPTTVILDLIPAFNWSFGCTATSAAMIAGHYDNVGYPNMYVGPTNGGIMPMDNSAWPDTNISGENRHQCPLSATANRLDGRTTAGHVDDYWISYGSPGPDPWTVAGGGTGVQHTYGYCTGDYMKTNQWLDPGNNVNEDGSTIMYSWTNGTPFTASDAVSEGVEDIDGMYGFKLFMESRGYTVNSTYTQTTNHGGSDFFTFAEFKNEIDNGRPVLIHITNHTMCGYGYNDAGGDSMIYIHDTWDYLNHSMRWEGSYDNKSMWGVTVIRLAASTYNVWNGSSSNNWGNSSNWSLGHVPTATENVIIPDVNQPVIVNASDRVCNSLYVYPGAHLRIYEYSLEVNAALFCYGQIMFLDDLAELYVHGTIYWQDGSTVSITSTDEYKPVIYAYGNWYFREGSNVMFTSGIVDFQAGTADSWIYSQSASSYFHHVRDNKTGGNSLGMGASCTEDCVIEGNMYMVSGSELVSSAGEAWRIGGYLNNQNGNIHLATGTLSFDGDPSLVGFKPNVGDYVRNLTINTGTNNFILNSTYSSVLDIKGNLTISSGYFYANAFTIKVDGNWSNLAAPSAFIQGTSRVIFEGTSDQYISGDEDFYYLETATGGNIVIDAIGDAVTCASYDWTTGGIDVVAGSFTAGDLYDNGVYGNFFLDSFGSINLQQDGSHWTDLNGSLHIYGGTMTIGGGTGSSQWAFSSAASLEMTIGTLEFEDFGVIVTTLNAFMDNITGGTIRTPGSFTINRNDFNPTGGKVEFSGTTDCNISNAAGSNFFNVVIAKSAKSPEDPVNNRYSANSPPPENDDQSPPDESGRYQKSLPPSRASTVTLTSNVDVNGSVTINAGTLDVSASNYSLNVAGNWTNNLVTANFNERLGTVTFDGTSGGSIMTDETFYTMAVNRVREGAEDLEMATDITVNVLNDLNILQGTLEINNSAVLDVGDDITISSGGGLNANDGAIAVFCSGDFTDQNATFDSYIGFNAGSSCLVTFDGDAVQYLQTAAPYEQFADLIINKAGSFRSYDNIKVTDDLDIVSGSWNDAVTGLNHYISDEFSVAAGANFYGSTGNTVHFISSNNQTVSFDPEVCGGYFYDVVIDKSVTTNPRNSSDEKGLETVDPVTDDPRSNLVTLSTDILALTSGNLTVQYGTLDLNGHYFRAVGDVKIFSGGKISVDPGAWLEVGGSDSLVVFSGGILEVLGNGTNEAMIIGQNNQNYTFEVRSGGTISAQHAIFEETGVNGLDVKTGALIDAANDFDYCTFRNGYSGTATLLTINNNQTFTIDSAYFPTSTTSKNVTKAVNQGSVTFVGATGPFSGPTWEDDVNGRIFWAEHGRWEGTVSTDWNTAGNWGFDLAPTSVVDVVIPAGCPNYPVLSGTLGVNYGSYTYAAKSLNINAGGRLTISGSTADLANYGNIVSNGDIYIGDDYFGRSGSVFNLQSDTVRCGINSTGSLLSMLSGGTFNQTGGTLIAESYTFADGSQFNGSFGTAHLGVLGSVPAMQSLAMNDADSYFNDLIVDAGTNASMAVSGYDLDASSMDIDGSFDLAGEDVTVDYLDVSGTLTLNNGSIVVNNNGPYFSPTSVFNMSGGTIDGGNSICFYNGATENVTGGLITVSNILIDDNGIFSPTGGTFEFNGATASHITGPSSFFDLVINEPGTTFENGSEGAGVNFSCNNLTITAGTVELNVPCTLSVATDLSIASGAYLNADDGAVVIQVGDDWWNYNTTTAYFVPGAQSSVVFNATVPGQVQAVREKARFRNLKVSTAGAYVRPDVTYQRIWCYNLDVLAGSLNVATYRVDVDYNATISGNLIMEDPSDTLNIGNNITWYSGSTAQVTAGTITVDVYWIFNDGTSAQLGTGNTVCFNDPGPSYLYCKDADACLGNVDLCKAPSSSAGTYIYTSSTQPVRVAGNLTLRNGNQFHTYNKDITILGQFINEAGSEIEVSTNGDVLNTLDFTLNGSMTVNGGNMLVHGAFAQSPGSQLTISSGTFICDQAYTAARSLYTMDGGLTMSNGLLEITHNHLNLGTGFIDNISGGTIRVGGTFNASSNVFQPTGGTVELAAYSGGGVPYIDLHTGNWCHNLVLNGNTTWNIGGAGPSQLTVNQDLTINSGSFNGSDDILYVGDDWANNVGSGGFSSGTSTLYFLGTNPEPDRQLISGTNTFYNATNQNTNTFVEFAGPTTIVNNYLAATNPSCESFITGTPFTVQNQMTLTQGSFALSASAPVVTVAKLQQGGTLQVTNGNFTASDLLDAYVGGDYFLYNGQINLCQDVLQFADINADITITGGEFNVYGGQGSNCYWPFPTAGSLTMSGGVLDIKNQGIYLFNNSFTENITGGVIRTTGYFGYNAGVTFFTPAGGAVEVYGDGTSYISLPSGCYFHDFYSSKNTGFPATASTNLDIKGELKVKSSVFRTNSKIINVGE
jgi:hypothetical protein